MLKGKMKWLLLGGLVLLFGAAQVGADYNVQDKSTYYNNASTGLRTNSTGSLLVEDVAPAMDANFTFSNIIVNTNLAVGAADSSAVLSTNRMRLGMLYIKLTPRAGVANVISRIAVQVRAHLYGNHDSLSTFPIYFNAGKDQTAIAAGAIDTTNTGHQLTGSATVPWSGEFVVTSDGARNAPGDAVAATAFSYPNGIAIPLNNIFGRDVYAPYISVRVRNIKTTGPGAAVTVHLVGTPL